MKLALLAVVLIYFVSPSTPQRNQEADQNVDLRMLADYDTTLEEEERRDRLGVSFLSVLADWILGRDESAPAERAILSQQLRALEEDIGRVDKREEELRRRKSLLDRHVRESSALPEDRRNEVVDELVEAELERLETLEWRLVRIRRRITSAIKITQKKLLR